MTSTKTSASSATFLESVLALKPAIAVFDCDGTLWKNNSGEDFFYWSMREGSSMVGPEVVAWAHPRYDLYRQGGVDEALMCGEMTAMYSGLAVDHLEAAAAKFFPEMVRGNIFPEMLQLTRALAAQGCELWAVSSTNGWVVREGVKEFGIPGAHILAACVECVNGRATEKIIRVPSGEGKVAAIESAIRRPIDAVFGNSVHDAAMLRIAKHAFAVNPNHDLELLAKEQGWTIYWPEVTRR